MVLVKLEDYYPNYKDMPSGMGFDMGDIKDFSVYAQGDDKVGSVHDVLVDEQDGRFRYYIVDTGFWVFGKKVLLPVGLGQVDTNDKCIYVNGLTKEQVEQLPDFDHLEKLDFETEEEIRNVYRSSTTTPTSADMAVTGTTATAGMAAAAAYDRNTYSYDQDPNLFDMSNHDNQTLKLYEERLIADKKRQRAGAVEVGKHVETQTTHVSVPVEKERVVIERTAPTSGTVANPGTDAFNTGEVARVSVYEEVPEIQKEAFVREEVKVKKVVDRDIVNVDEEIRREELDVNTDGRAIIDNQI